MLTIKDHPTEIHFSVRLDRKSCVEQLQKCVEVTEGKGCTLYLTSIWCGPYTLPEAFVLLGDDLYGKFATIDKSKVV